MSGGYAPYPCHRGVFVPVYELSLPPSRLNPERQTNYNNHHFAFTARRMGRLLITSTWRDLMTNQQVMPKDSHVALHQRYDPPVLPELHDIMNTLDDAYQSNQLLRYGSASHPEYQAITASLMQRIKAEYEVIR